MIDYDEQVKFTKKYLREQEEKRKRELESQHSNIQDQRQQKDEQHYDKPGTIETKTAIILYILIMIIGSIFIERVYVYIGATAALICFLNRHKLKKRR